MDLASFVQRSEGEWRSMRSGHSLAFQHFEEVLSKISIEKLEVEDPRVTELIASHSELNIIPVSPFRMEWSAESDWEPDDPNDVSAGSCILVPLPLDEHSGWLLRSVGYAEAEEATGQYRLLEEGTFLLKTRYGQSIAEERIWFVSENVRCRASVLRTSEGTGVLQTSFSSEIRRIKV